MEEQKNIQMIEMDQIEPNQHQPRKNFNEESLKELASSIASYGLIQPICVRKQKEGKFEIIAGERRYRAALMAGMLKIPSVIMTLGDEDASAIALIENLQREDLNQIEEAKAYVALLESLKVNQNQLAERIGKKQSTIANKIRLLKLNEAIQQMIISGQLTERHGRALLKLDKDSIRIEVANRIIKNNLTVKETEKLIDDIIEKVQQKDEAKSKGSIRNFINYKIYVNTIKHAYKEILKTGVSANFEEKEYEDHIEVLVRIPKNS